MRAVSQRPRSRLRTVIGIVVLVTLLGAMLKGIEEWAVGALIYAPNVGVDPSPGDPPSEATLVRIEREGATIEAFVFTPVAPRATVVLLHGLRDHKASYESTARRFADEGYRVVLPDLRGHGHSSGDFLTYGLLDADDIAALLDEVERTAPLGPVAVVGASYGGAVALRFAGQDPRVRVVVTVATFASLRGILPGYARLLAPMLPPPPEWFIDWTLSDAGERAGVDYALCDSVAAVRAVRAPILFVHGEDDVHIPIENAEQLFAACWPGRCTLERRPGRDHGSILSDGATWERVLAFLGEQLASDAP